MAHDPISPNGVRRWGVPYHGLWKAGKVTLPNGSQVDIPSPVDGSVSVVRVPGVAPVTAEPSDVAGGLQWLNYLLVNPSADYPGSKLSWVYTKDGPGKLVVISTSYGWYGEGLNCTVAVPFGAEPSPIRQLIVPDLPGNASFRCAKSDGSEAFFLDGYRGWTVSLSGAVEKNAPAHGLSASAVCVNPEKHQHSTVTNLYMQSDTGVVTEIGVIRNTSKQITHVHSKYVLHAAYDQNDNLVICWQESTYDRTQIQVGYSRYIRDENGSITSIVGDTFSYNKRDFSSSIVFGASVLYSFQDATGGTWYSPYGTETPTQLPPPEGYEPAHYTSDAYVDPNEGPSMLFSGKYIILKMWTNSVLGISTLDMSTREQRHKNAFSPSGKSELFDISIDTPCFLTWHPVNDVLVKDTELIAWV